jgi:hypothetical protein
MKLKIAAIKHNICTKAVPLRPNSYCALQRAIFLNSGTIVKIFRGRRKHPTPGGREIQTIQTNCKKIVEIVEISAQSARRQKIILLVNSRNPNYPNQKSNE